MSMTSKSPKAVATAAYEAGKKALPKYASKYSRRDFTCAQLFAILVLRKFFKQDYRGAIAFLQEWSDLRDILELHDKLPHFTTPQKACGKLMDDALFRKLLKQTLEQFYRYPKHAQIDDDDVAWVARIDLAAGDSTGFESGHCSKYFTSRRKRGKNKGDPDEPVAYRRFPKLGVVADCGSHMILSRAVGMGPRPDNDQVLPLMEGMTGDVLPDTMLWDAGYDSENNHELLREYLEIESIIPPNAGRPTDKLPTTKWRWLMATGFDTEEVYGQRWQVETVMRMIKARQGESLTARSNQARNHEMSLMVLTHNLMVVLRLIGEGFYRAFLTPFPVPPPRPPRTPPDQTPQRPLNLPHPATRRVEENPWNHGRFSLSWWRSCQEPFSLYSSPFPSSLCASIMAMAKAMPMVFRPSVL